MRTRPAGAAVSGHQIQLGGNLLPDLNAAGSAHRGNHSGRAQHPDTGDLRDSPAGWHCPGAKMQAAALLIQPGHACPLLALNLHDHRQQPLRDPSEGGRNADGAQCVRSALSIHGMPRRSTGSSNRARKSMYSWPVLVATGWAICDLEHIGAPHKIAGWRASTNSAWLLASSLGWRE